MFRLVQLYSLLVTDTKQIAEIFFLNMYKFNESFEVFFFNGKNKFHMWEIF